MQRLHNHWELARNPDNQRAKMVLEGTQEHAAACLGAAWRSAPY